VVVALQYRSNNRRSWALLVVEVLNVKPPFCKCRCCVPFFVEPKNNYMKVKLLKKLRQIGRDMVNITSVTTTGDLVTGMAYGYDTKEYSDLFELGDTETDVKNKACKIYLETNIEAIRKKYRKYSRVCR